MTTRALVLEGSPPGQADLAADLASAGIHVLGAAARGNLVREALQRTPDVVVCHEASVDDALFQAFALLAEAAPCPVVVFTQDPDAARIEQAMRSGVHAYVVNGYTPARLRAVLHLARARFAADRALRAELAEVSRRFDERKLVDRAKGILMRARQVSEDEAFAVLRAASMHSNRRVGQVSRQVIAAAHYADAVNRAGKLRMLSQRLVKLYALRLLQPASDGYARRFDDSAAQIEAVIGALGKSLSKPTFGDLLETVTDAWDVLHALVAGPPTPERLPRIDALAEQLLQQADRLTRQLETAGLVTTLHVINVSGRQRMLAQRQAKEALLAMLGSADRSAAARAGPAQSAETFDAAMAHLKTVPLSTPEIRVLIDDAERLRDELGRATRSLRGIAGAQAIDAASEALLEVMEQLTDRYERSMQVLMG